MNDLVSVRMLISEDARVQSKEPDRRTGGVGDAVVVGRDFRENQPEVCPE